MTSTLISIFSVIFAYSLMSYALQVVSYTLDGVGIMEASSRALPIIRCAPITLVVEVLNLLIAFAEMLINALYQLLLSVMHAIVVVIWEMLLIGKFIDAPDLRKLFPNKIIVIDRLEHECKRHIQGGI